MSLPISNISRWEIEAAAYLEQKLTENFNGGNIRVKLWADAFKSNENPNQKVQLFLGHQKTERDRIGTKFLDNGEETTVYLLRYFVEIRVEIFTIKNHQSALDLIEFSLDHVLKDLRPFWEFSKFIIGESGGVTRNERLQSWVYQGSGYTEIFSDVLELTQTYPVLNLSKIINIGLTNSQAELDNQLIGTFKPETI